MRVVVAIHGMLDHGVLIKKGCLCASFPTWHGLRDLNDL